MLSNIWPVAHHDGIPVPIFKEASDPDDDDIEDGMLDSEQWDRCYVEKMIPEYFSVKLN